MSAFLGPIHYWLFNKIQLQQSITNDVMNLGNQYGFSLEEEANEQFGYSETQPLEEIIDEGNIHGWLQERVSQAEYKYAYSVNRILKKDPNAMTALKDLLYQHGEELARSIGKKDLNASELFKLISDTLLDGMPCDHANSLIKNNEEEVIWKRSLCVHESYWNEVGGDISVYYELRDAWLKGLGKVLGFDIAKTDETTYCLRRN